MAKRPNHYQDLERRTLAFVLFHSSGQGSAFLDRCALPDESLVQQVFRVLPAALVSKFHPMFVRSALRRSAAFAEAVVSGREELEVACPRCAAPVGRACRRTAHDERMAQAAAERGLAPRLVDPPTIAPSLGVDRAWRLLELARLARQRLPVFRDGFPYIARPHRCYSCGGTTLAYTWLGWMEWTGRKPPRPLPHNLSRRGSKTADTSYWANSCSLCNALLGDWFLYHDEEQGTFRDLAVVDLTDAFAVEIGGSSGRQALERVVRQAHRLWDSRG